LFKTMSNTYIVHIPFRGGGPAGAALLGGEIEVQFDNIPPQVGNIKAGKVRALAVTSLKRNSAIPDVPTLDEVGLKGYEVVSWFGLAARAGTPPENIQRLNTALNNATKNPKLRDALESRGADVVQGTPEDFTSFVKNEIAKFAPVIQRTGVTVE
jgi:tripartite-type tricarboxylate transporter receptor subunit TctC